MRQADWRVAHRAVRPRVAHCETALNNFAVYSPVDHEIARGYGDVIVCGGPENR